MYGVVLSTRIALCFSQDLTFRFLEHAGSNGVIRFDTGNNIAFSAHVQRKRGSKHPYNHVSAIILRFYKGSNYN